jgi:hypothetical protein
MSRVAAMSRQLSFLSVFVLLAGCATKPEIVPSSGPRAATTPNEVAFYDKAPKKYELLGTVTVNKAEGAAWDERGDANAAFDALKAKAAALGANGLLLSANPGEFDRRATVGYHGTFYQVPVRGMPGVGVAQAIYVLKK